MLYLLFFTVGKETFCVQSTGEKNQCYFFTFEVGLTLFSLTLLSSLCLNSQLFNLIGAFCAWQQTVLMNRPISLLIKRSKGLSEVVKGKHSAHRLNRCMIGYVQYPDTLIVTGVGISAGAVFFNFYLCIQEILIYVMSWLWMCASLLKFSF